MSFKKLEENITELENKSTSVALLGFNLQSLLLDKRQIAIKILMHKNPQMTQLEAAFIVDSVLRSAQFISEELEKIDKESEKEELNLTRGKLSEEEKRKRREEARQRRELLKKQIRDKILIYKETFAAKLNAILEEAEQVLKDIKAAIIRLIKDAKDVTKKFVTATIKTFSAIPGVLLIASTPPWNIPNAISTTMVIIETYLDLLNLTRAVVPFLDPLRKLPLVTTKENLAIISSILNVPITIMLALWIPIDEISAAIQRLIQAVLNLLKRDPNNNPIFRKVTRQLRKLGHIPRSFYLPGVERRSYEVDDAPGVRVFAIDDDNVSEIYDILQTFRLSGNQYDPGTRDRVVGYNQVTTDLINKFEDMATQFENERNLIPIPDTQNAAKQGDTRSAVGSTVFDVQLPDGSNLYGITQEQLDELKLTYNVVIREIDDFERRLASQDTQSVLDRLSKLTQQISAAQPLALSSSLSDILSSTASITILSPSIPENIKPLDVAKVSKLISTSQPVFTISSDSGIVNATITVTTSTTSKPNLRIVSPEFDFGTTNISTHSKIVAIKLKTVNISSSEQIKVSKNGKVIRSNITFSPTTGDAEFRLLGTVGQTDNIIVTASNIAGDFSVEFSVRYLDKNQPKPFTSITI